LDDLANPVQAAVTSAISFALGAAAPLLAAAIVNEPTHRLISIAAVSVVGLIVCGVAGSILGGADALKGGTRVCVGGIIALAATYGAGVLFGEEGAV
jgi:vacuolar iron transporter family protein